MGCRLQPPLGCCRKVRRGRKNEEKVARNEEGQCCAWTRPCRLTIPSTGYFRLFLHSDTGCFSSAAELLPTQCVMLYPRDVIFCLCYSTPSFSGPPYVNQIKRNGERPGASHPPAAEKEHHAQNRVDIIKSQNIQIKQNSTGRNEQNNPERTWRRCPPITRGFRKSQTATPA